MRKNCSDNRGHLCPKRSSEEAKKAIAYCQCCIHTYEDWFEWNEARWLGWQKVVIIGGVIATLAGVITIPEKWLWWLSEPQSFGWIRGVPAAIVTIAAGYYAAALTPMDEWPGAPIM